MRRTILILLLCIIGNGLLLLGADFKRKNLSDNIFTFNKKNYPSAEVIDLR